MEETEDDGHLLQLLAAGDAIAMLHLANFKALHLANFKAGLKILAYA